MNGTARLRNQTLNYVVYVPRDWSSQKKWPVLLFLHGAGERGSDGLKQSQVGLPGAIRMHPERFPCVVVMPQCPEGKGWGAGIAGFTQDEPGIAELALQALEDVVQRYAGDRERLYLTGLSLGGYGTWSIGAAHPNRFAALAPVCGGGRVESAAALKGVPIWAFHGDADTVVPPIRSREMVEAVRAAGNPHVKYTEYAGVGHNSWDRAYGEPEFMSWLLAQKRAR
ncbi:MAG: phospholipase [Armatimonadetes bacterium]|nr:phospholipase [Armatimonadota bacterium]